MGWELDRHHEKEVNDDRRSGFLTLHRLSQHERKGSAHGNESKLRTAFVAEVFVSVAHTAKIKPS